MNRSDLKQLRAGDLMKPTVQWARTNESLRAAGQRMAAIGVRALLVPGDEPDDLPGIVTSKDIANLLGTHPVDVLDRLTVRDVMTRPAICVPQQANLLDCLNLMRATRVRRLPVLDGTAVVGVLSMSDVLDNVLQPC
ncbi:MAG: CBS domain-containing protein [Planctomycetes bacterium]|nr:CBS domain-containing protein [Planctomycetota bacterium]